MDYTGKWFTKHSEDFGMDVHVLEYRSDRKTKIPYCDCDRCGKPIINHMFVIQGAEDDVEMAYYGADCIKKLK